MTLWIVISLWVNVLIFNVSMLYQNRNWKLRLSNECKADFYKKIPQILIIFSTHLLLHLLIWNWKFIKLGLILYFLMLIRENSIRPNSYCQNYSMPNSLISETRPNEFGSMTARKGDIKPQYYKEQGHTWLHKTIKDHKR